jgi:hypothetical protein
MTTYIPYAFAIVLAISSTVQAVLQSRERKFLVHALVSRTPLELKRLEAPSGRTQAPTPIRPVEQIGL